MTLHAPPIFLRLCFCDFSPSDSTGHLNTVGTPHSTPPGHAPVVMKSSESPILEDDEMSQQTKSTGGEEDRLSKGRSQPLPLLIWQIWLHGPQILRNISVSN